MPPIEGPSGDSRRGGTIAALILGGALVCALAVATERGFPYWDFAAYQADTLAAADHLHEFLTGEITIPLFAAPLVPWVVLFGDSRLVYILAVYFTFFVPYLLVLAAIARRVWPRQPGLAGALAVASGLATPACWSHVLQGYPDIGGAVLISGCVLIYGGRIPGGRVWAWLQIGVLAGLSVVFRRHYIYGALALYAGIGLDIAIAAIRDRRMGTALRDAAGTVVSAAAAVGVIVWLNPQFFTVALRSGAEMAPYQQSVGTILMIMAYSIGGIPLALAVTGWAWSWRAKATRAAEFRLAGLATLAWIALWAGHARQGSYHYPHWLPTFAALGLTFLLVNLMEIAVRWRRRLLVAAVAGVMGLAWVLSMPLLAFEVAEPVSRRLLAPDRIERAINSAYEAVLEVVQYLRAEASPGDPILVAASSSILNFDILRNAEIALYGRRHTRLEILVSPQANSAGMPTNQLLRAQLVVVAEPFQHHLAEEDQKVVQVLLEAFARRWPIADDFELLPRSFPLPDEGGAIRIYHRVRPSGADVAADTARRIDEFVSGKSTRDGVWFLSSRFNSEVVRQDDGTFRVTAHPARASDDQPTLVMLAGQSWPSAELSGTLSFYDSRCLGVRIDAWLGTGTEVEKVPLGAYDPAGKEAPVSGRFPDLRGRPLALEIRSNPREPENIDSCTIVLNNLRVRGR